MESRDSNLKSSCTVVKAQVEGMLPQIHLVH